MLTLVTFHYLYYHLLYPPGYGTHFWHPSGSRFVLLLFAYVYCVCNSVFRLVTYYFELKKSFLQILPEKIPVNIGGKSRGKVTKLLPDFFPDNQFFLT